MTALQSDAAVTHPDTLAALSLCLRQLHGAAEAALPSEHLYWLVLNATKAMHMACTSLVTAGFAGEAMQRSAKCYGCCASLSPDNIVQRLHSGALCASRAG